MQAPLVPTSTPSQQAKAPSPPNAFLNNKPLAGVVFGLVALVTLILLVVAITYGVRRRRRNRLQSISFDPDTTSNHTYNHLIESGLGVQRQGSQSTTGQGRDTSSYDSGLYPDYSGQQHQHQHHQQQLYPGPTLFAQNPAYSNQQAYYNPQQHPPAYGFPSSLVPGYSPDTAYPSAHPGSPVLTQQQQAYTAAGLALGRRRNDSLSSLPSIVTSSQTHHRDGVGQGPAPDPSLPSPPLPNPYGDAVSPKEQMPSQSLSRDVQPAPLKLAIPTAEPLPDHFGSDASSRSSMEADMQFWSRRLKVGSPFLISFTF